MSRTTYTPILVSEPNEEMLEPYSFFPDHFLTYRFSSLVKSTQLFLNLQPRVVFLSTSYEPEAIITFLEQIKNECVDTLIPVVLVVDLLHPVNVIPGTRWGERLGILSSLSSPGEVEATLVRIMGDAYYEAKP